MTMPTPEKLNPNVLKVAAELAVPGKEWFIRRSFHNLNQEYIDDVLCVDGNNFKAFDVIASDGDAMKLERALKKEYWRFFYEPGKFCAQQRMMADMKAKPVYQDDSDTLLLLKCVAAMKSLELFGEGE